MAKNENLHTAKAAKNDEFYTQLKDIENEVEHYEEHFAGKTVLCNCNDVVHKNFTRYFFNNFNRLGLKKLICTGYKVEGEHGKVCSYNGKEWTINILDGDGDFRSKECIELLKESDIIVTNPPFSLFRQYVAQLMEYDKKFLIIGNVNAISYKDVFPLIKENKMWFGVTLFTGKMPFFRVPDDYEITNSRFERRADGLYKQVNSIAWYTNLDHKKRHEEILLYKKYDAENYPKYDNYDAIEISKVTDIPMDYEVERIVTEEELNKLTEQGFHIEIIEEL